MKTAGAVGAAQLIPPRLQANALIKSRMPRAGKSGRRLARLSSAGRSIAMTRTMITRTMISVFFVLLGAMAVVHATPALSSGQRLIPTGLDQHGLSSIGRKLLAFGGR